MEATADSDVEVDKKVAAAAHSIQNLSETCCTKPDQSVQGFPQTDAKTSLKDSCESTIGTSGAENAHIGCSAENSHISYNLSVEGENNVPSGKAFDKENVKEGKVFKKAISMDNPDYVSASGASSALVTQGVNPTGKRAAGFTEGSCIVSSAVTTAQMSNLPSPDSLSSSYASSQRPFTDSSQQMRGMALDEDLVLSAFGGPDGGRSALKPVQPLAVERLHNQNSVLSNSQTSGARATEEMKRIVSRSEEFGAVSGSESNKCPALACYLNKTCTSLLRTVSTACPEGSLSTSPAKWPFVDSALTCFAPYPFQDSHATQYVGNTSPWLHETLFPETTFITPQTAAVSDDVGHPRSTERASTGLPAPTINSDSSGPKTHEKPHPTRRKVLLDLRGSFPIYLTLFTILFTLTLPHKEKWVFVFFMCLCGFFFIWMGCDACEDIEDIEESEEDIEESEEKTYVNVRKWDLLKSIYKHKVRRDDLESGRPLLDKENRRIDNKDRRMRCCKCSPKTKVAILTIFSVLYIFLLTVHMYSEACATLARS